MFTLTAEADRVLCQLVMFLTVFFSTKHCTKWNSAAIKSLLLFMTSLFIVFLVEKYVACQSQKSDFFGIVFVFHLAWRVRGLNSLKRFWPYLMVFSASRMVSLSNYFIWCLFFISNSMKSSVVYGAAVFCLCMFVTIETMILHCHRK